MQELNYAQQLADRYEKDSRSVIFARYAESLRINHQIEEAEKICLQGISNFPDYVTGYLILGKVLVEKGNKAEAISWFEKAYELDSRCTGALKASAEVLLSQNQKASAAQKFKTILEIDPLNADIQALFEQYEGEVDGEEEMASPVEEETVVDSQAELPENPIEEAEAPDSEPLDVVSSEAQPAPDKESIDKEQPPKEPETAEEETDAEIDEALSEADAVAIAEETPEADEPAEPAESEEPFSMTSLTDELGALTDEPEVPETSDAEPEPVLEAEVSSEENVSEKEEESSLEEATATSPESLDNGESEPAAVSNEDGTDGIGKSDSEPDAMGEEIVQTEEVQEPVSISSLSAELGALTDEPDVEEAEDGESLPEESPEETPIEQEEPEVDNESEASIDAQDDDVENIQETQDDLSADDLLSGMTDTDDTEPQQDVSESMDESDGKSKADSEKKELEDEFMAITSQVDEESTETPESEDALLSGLSEELEEDVVPSAPEVSDTSDEALANLSEEVGEDVISPEAEAIDDITEEVLAEVSEPVVDEEPLADITDELNETTSESEETKIEKSVDESVSEAEVSESEDASLSSLSEELEEDVVPSEAEAIDDITEEVLAEVSEPVVDEEPLADITNELNEVASVAEEVPIEEIVDELASGPDVSDTEDASLSGLSEELEESAVQEEDGSIDEDESFLSELLNKDDSSTTLEAETPEDATDLLPVDEMVALDEVSSETETKGGDESDEQQTDLAEELTFLSGITNETVAEDGSDDSEIMLEETPDAMPDIEDDLALLSGVDEEDNTSVPDEVSDDEFVAESAVSAEDASFVIDTPEQSFEEDGVSAEDIEDAFDNFALDDSSPESGTVSADGTIENEEDTVMLTAEEISQIQQESIQSADKEDEIEPEPPYPSVDEESVNEAHTTPTEPAEPLNEEIEESATEPVASSGNLATVTLAEIYFKQGLKEQSLSIYRKLLKHEPDNKDIQERIKVIENTVFEEKIPNPVADEIQQTRRPRPGVRIKKRKR
ncbi:MAG: hypothetical protein HQK83_06125 [Fibrobacteria bacterium]|nr:hypothetical protein [Fibrobacteria bacterium]